MNGTTIIAGCVPVLKEPQKREPAIQGGMKVKLICSMQVSSDRRMRLSRLRFQILGTPSPSHCFPDQIHVLAVSWALLSDLLRTVARSD